MSDERKQEHPSPSTRTERVLELARLFLRLGFTAFGGPAAHIALYHDETVKRRKWLSDQQFMDLLGATNLIPGPNSTEMTIHIGYLRAGWAGLLVSGWSFILPSTFMVLAIAWGYVHYGALPEITWLLYGIKPVVIAIILQALWALGRTAIKDYLTAAAALFSLLLYILGANPILALVLGGLMVFAGKLLPDLLRKSANGLWLLPSGWLAQHFAGSALDPATHGAAPFNLSTLFFVFLKIGSVLYGSGYVLLAFLHTDFVANLGWLTDQQLLDAISIGQVTPGPVFTTATFIGYVLGGVPGALLSTLGIFLPSFFFVALSNPLIPRLRSSKVTARLLDGINAASLGLMAAVAWQLAQSAFVDLPALFAGLVSAALLLRFRLNSTWLVLGGAVFGLLRSAVL